MRTLASLLLAAAILASPAMAQKSDAPKADAAKKVVIPRNTFFKGQTASQYLASQRLIGAKVVNSANQTIGTIDDLIVSSTHQIEGVILGVGGFLGVGERKIGVRIGALKIETAAGKTTVSLPNVTKEMLAAIEPYQRAIPAKK